VIACVAENRAADALDQLNELVTNGADLRQLNLQFAEEWRGLMLARAGADLVRVMDCTEDDARELKTLAGQFSLDDLMACARVFARDQGPARGLPVPQLALELSLLECLSIQRHDALAAQAAAPAPRAELSPPPTREALASSAPAKKRDTQPAAPIEELDLAAIDAGTWAGPGRPMASAPAQTTRMAPASATPPESATPAPAETPMDALSDEQLPDAGDDGRNWVAEAQSKWQLIRKICRQKPPMGTVASGLLSAVEPVSVVAGNPPTLVIRTKFDIHLTKFRDTDMREAVEWALEQALGQPFRAHFISANEPQRGAGARQSRDGVDAAPRAMSAQASAPQRPQAYERGANGAGNSHGAASNGLRDAPPRATSQPPVASASPVTGHASQPAEPAAPPAHLEQAARQDPVVQEFARMLNAEVAEVRALDTHDGDES
jgi:DNA polymerase III gamma/tau subunit